MEETGKTPRRDEGSVDSRGKMEMISFSLENVHNYFSRRCWYADENSSKQYFW